VNLLINCPQHFDRTPDGQVWTNGQFPYSFWTRYHAAFDGVTVLARVRDVPELSSERQTASGTGVRFLGLPDYTGPRQYAFRVAAVATATRKAVQNGSAILLRPPSETTGWVLWHTRKSGRPYGVEVVADPYDVFGPNAVRHPLRPIFRSWFTRALKRQCANACAAAYVTEQALQRRYPPGPNALVTHYSDIELPESAFASAPRRPRQNGMARIIFVGTLAQLYKAPDALIDAIATCCAEADVELVIVGSGRYQLELEQRAKARGLGDRVRFRGQLITPQDVRAELDRADLFVLPSRQEGLPRAMIEAMARGLPCIGSNVGGIPELLAAEDTVPPNNVPALASKIMQVLQQPARMQQMSARNFIKSGRYRDDVLNARRLQFYEFLRNRTEDWLKRNPSVSRSKPMRQLSHAR
jgi:glycosyltransferase involved in cell wall biosynthesis